ncbi:TonB-dependent receptor plug domain-containing protein [Pelosinus sp. sgz500959]|uniref:TonB-dependent receptor plug domain-containing protein n=1 Tax=Pelosinus sp. sgz500959 TaxID=3242472 RepID=UPI00366B25F6
MKQTRSIRKRQAVLCAMVSSALFLQLQGITLAAEQGEGYSFDQVIVSANRVPSKASEAAANVTVVTREDIEKGNYKTITDILKHVNGVAIISQGFGGGEQHALLNGDQRVGILIDGRRLNLSKLAGNFDRATYDLNAFPSLDNIERIEIVKGASSAQYGSDAVGGVINIITRQGTEAKSTLDISTGSWGTQNYNFTTSGHEKDWQWFVTAGKAKQDHFSYKKASTGQNITMPNSAYDKNSMTVRLDKKLNEDSSITFNIEHSDDHKGQPWGAILPDTTSYLDTTSNNWALTYNYDKKSELPAYLRLYQNDYNYDMNSSNYLYTNKEKGLEWQDGWKLDNKNFLVSGIQWRDVDVTYPGVYDGKSINNKSVYLEDRMNLSSKWTFTPGLRYDHHSMFGSATTPRAAVNYQMDNKTDIYVSWGKVFNAPTTDDLFWPYSAMGSWIVSGNPNLKPETGYTTTIGMNKKLNDTTELKASYFQSQLKDAIRWDSVGTVSTPSNVDQMKKQGAELEVRTNITQNWSLMAGYSYLQMKSKTSSSSDYTLDPANTQPNGYKLGVTYKKDAWNIDMTGTGATGRSLARFTSNSYWVWDLSVNYDVNKQTRTYVKVNNITNQAYEVWGNSTIGNFPMPGRNYQVGVQYQF